MNKTGPLLNLLSEFYKNLNFVWKSTREYENKTFECSFKYVLTLYENNLRLFRKLCMTLKHFLMYFLCRISFIISAKRSFKLRTQIFWLNLIKNQHFNVVCFFLCIKVEIAKVFSFSSKQGSRIPINFRQKNV